MREPLFEAAFAFLEVCTSATLRRSASIRSITGVSGTGSGRLICSPLSFAAPSVTAEERKLPTNYVESLFLGPGWLDADLP